ncbi:MAG: hypothetical protein GQ564_18195 [Bacteroidales bacterium]|nr:hypothetical protein [Bacteroidales bacterium]
MRRTLILMILLSITGITFSQETKLDKEQEKIKKNNVRGIYNYVDAKTAEALRESKKYTDKEKADAIRQLELYTDEAKAEAISISNEYTDEAKADAINELKIYTDQAKTNVINESSLYTDEAKAEAISISNEYTDEAKADAINELKIYTDQAKTNAINESTMYTDQAKLEAINKSVTNANSYTDTKLEEKIGPQFTWDGNGIGIGTETVGSFKLAVEGKIGAHEIVISTDGWADFVFEPTYNLMPLKELDTYIQENKHLPEIPTTAEVQENGISVGEMNAKLLQKIEELTLYVIELKKEVEILKEQNNN